MSKAAELAALIGSQTALSNRNLIINGAMQVAQRGTSVAMAHDGNTSNYLIDRFGMSLGGTHEQFDGTYAQVADHPLSTNGKSLKWTTGTAESSYDADEYIYFKQVIEAQNLQRINNGNSNAVPLTLSFYVKSSITGTFAVGLYKEDTTARIFNQTYAISSANTWEKKTITFAGDTAGGGIVNDNGRGFYVNWHIAAGSNAVGGGSTSGWKDYSGLSDWADGQATNAVATTAGATWQITDCQLEVGEQATPFEHRSFGDELAKCLRYYYRTPSPNGGLGANEPFPCVGNMDGSQTGAYILKFPIPMRAAPSAIEQSGTASDYSIRVTSDANGTSVPSAAAFTTESALINLVSSGAGFTSGDAAFMRAESTDAFLAFSAEL